MESETLKNTIKCATDSIMQCKHLTTLINSLHKHYKEHKQMDNEYISQTLNDFIHLLHSHQTDTDFEYIYSQIGHCDVEKCAIFQRHIRDRMHIEYDDCEEKTENEIIYYDDIMDKIHCYYAHSFETGNRLCIKDKLMLNDDCSKESDTEHNIYISRDNETRKIYDISLAKREKMLSVLNSSRLNARINTKYNQLDLKHEYQAAQNNNGKPGLFSFGYKFIYGYDDEDPTDFSKFLDSDFKHETVKALSPIDFSSRDKSSKKWSGSVAVTQKYCDLKQELTNNKISIMTLEQFNHEYKKAQSHFNTDYCKSNFISQHSTVPFDLQYLLSLMVYCNYDQLQYNFSKTYREIEECKHDEFYNLGKYLKISVQMFGTKVGDGHIKIFLHGISDQMIIPPGPYGVKIKCPLSTTPSLTVAINFTNHKKGLIVQFTAPRYMADCKYIAASWISDFAYEKEHLFIQNNGAFETLKISNIIDVCHGFHYGIILKATMFIDQITRGVQSLEAENSVIRQLAIKILHNQISFSSSLYERFHSLTEYAHYMIQMYFVSKQDICVDCSSMVNAEYPDLTPLFLKQEFKWVNLNILHALFPNINWIMTTNTNLCSKVVEDIIRYLQNNKTKSKLKRIGIYKIDICSELSICEAVSKYSRPLKKIGFSITKWKWPSGSEKEKKYGCGLRIDKYGTKVESFTERRYSIDVSNEFWDKCLDYYRVASAILGIAFLLAWLTGWIALEKTNGYSSFKFVWN
eukprot:459001_1